jgi:ABC-type uncharacterized transport system substrate-binding protein
LRAFPVSYNWRYEAAGELVAYFAHPGGNVTGMSVQQAEIASKRVELLREVVPLVYSGRPVIEPHRSI